MSFRECASVSRLRCVERSTWRCSGPSPEGGSRSCLVPTGWPVLGGGAFANWPRTNEAASAPQAKLPLRAAQAHPAEAEGPLVRHLLSRSRRAEGTLSFLSSCESAGGGCRGLWSALPRHPFFPLHLSTLVEFHSQFPFYQSCNFHFPLCIKTQFPLSTVQFPLSTVS